MKPKLPKRLYDRKVLKGRFEDVQFMTAETKEKVVYDWESFLRKRLLTPQSEVDSNEYGVTLFGFTDNLYHHLSQHCGYIAHFNRYGFFQVQFRFPRQFLDNVHKCSHGYEYMQREYADVQGHMSQIADHYMDSVMVYDQDDETTRINSEVNRSINLLRAEGYEVRKL